MKEYRDMVDDVWDRIDEEICKQNLNKTEVATVERLLDGFGISFTERLGQAFIGKKYT